MWKRNGKERSTPMMNVAVKNRKWISASNRSPRRGERTRKEHVQLACAHNRRNMCIVTSDHPRLEITDSRARRSLLHSISVRFSRKRAGKVLYRPLCCVLQRAYRLQSFGIDLTRENQFGCEKVIAPEFPRRNMLNITNGEESWRLD